MKNHTNLGLRFFKRNRAGNLESVNGNAGEWIPGEWKVWPGELKLCQSGFHFCREPSQALYHRQGYILGLIEWRGEVIHDPDGKSICREMRLLQEYDTVFLAIIADCYAYAAANAANAAYAANAADAAAAAAAADDAAAYAYATYAANVAANAAAADKQIWEEVL